MNNMPLESQKTDAITFPLDCCVFDRFDAVPPGFAHCVTCCFDSGVYWWIHVSSMISKWCKKSLELSLERSKQLCESRIRWHFCSIVSKRGTYFAVSFHMPKLLCKISITQWYKDSANENLIQK